MTRTTRSSRKRPALAAGGQPESSWGDLHEPLLRQVFQAAQTQDGDGLESLRAFAAVLSTCRHWRAVAKQMTIDVVCPPSTQLIAWLRHVRVARLELQQAAAAPRSPLLCLGYVSSEQRYRAAVSTLLATLDFINNSGPCLKVLSGVHPREGILHLTPFQALERVSMTGTASETCKLGILGGLPSLREVLASGYGEYETEGLPSGVRHLDLQWAVSPSSFATIYFDLPPGDSHIDCLLLAAQRPLCLPAPCLARCGSVTLSARRAYLGLPLRRGAPWADVDDLAARFAQFMLEGRLEALEVTSTRFFVFQPVQDTYDLQTNEGLGGIAQHEPLATVLSARHFQSLHMEQRTLAVGAFRAYIRISRRRAEPIAFSFGSQLNAEQLAFLQRHALATSITFGPMSQSDALSVLNCGAFAERNAGLLGQLQHLEVSSRLNLAPYTALQSVQGTWHSEPSAPLGTAQLTSLRLTPALGAPAAQRAFRSRWLGGLRHLGSLMLSRFASADFSHLRARPATIHMSTLQPPGGLVTPSTLQLPGGGFGPGCSLTLRMAYAPPHPIQAGPAAAPVAVHPGAGNGPVLFPGALAVAMQQHAAQQAAAAAAAAAQAAADAAAQHQLGPAVPAQQQQPGGVQGPGVGPAGAQQQQQGQGQPQFVAPGQVALLPAIPPAVQQAGAAMQVAAAAAVGAAAAAAAAVAGAGAAANAEAAAAAAAGGGDIIMLVDDTDDEDEPPGLMMSDDEDELLAPQAGGAGNGGGANAALLGAAGGLGLGPWVVVAPPVLNADGQGLAGPAQQEVAAVLQQAAAQPQHGDFLQPWGMPDDRLSDVTICHDELFCSVGNLSVHAGVLTIIYQGSGPDHLLQLLTGGSPDHAVGTPGGSGSGQQAGGGGGGALLRTLRLNARQLVFEAVPPKAGEGPAAGQQAGGSGEQAHADAAAEAGPSASSSSSSSGCGSGATAAAEAGALPAAERLHVCSGAELRDYVNGSEWGSLWEAKLHRSMFRDQETLVLVRREPAAAASPAPGAALLDPAAAAPPTR